MCEEVSVETKSKWGSNVWCDIEHSKRLCGYVWEEEREERWREGDRQRSKSSGILLITALWKSNYAFQMLWGGEGKSRLSFFVCQVLLVHNIQTPAYTGGTIWIQSFICLRPKHVCAVHCVDVCISGWILRAYNLLKNKSAFSGRAGLYFELNWTRRITDCHTDISLEHENVMECGCMRL